MKDVDFDDAYDDDGVTQDDSAWDLNRPETWPPLPRVLLLCAIAVVTAILIWQFWSGGVRAELDRARGQQLQSEEMQRVKREQVDGMADLRRQHSEILQGQDVARLAVQLPESAELDALAADLHRAAERRGLRLELFRPSAAVLQDAYAELPVMLKVTGGFHGLGAWVADVAGLPRIVTLHNMSVLPGSSADGLVLEATLKAYRALNAAERAARPLAAAAPRASSAEASPTRRAVTTTAVAYTGTTSVDPYSRAKLEQTASVPRRATVRGETQQSGSGSLQDLPLSALRMAGSLRRQGRVAALIEAGGRVHLVEPGARIGRGGALVVRISETQMVLHETVPVAAGATRTREIILRLREK